MIELISSAQCTNCDLCVRVCPNDVFAAVPDATPVIARQQDCHTCFLCELYCPTDALYVSPRDVPEGFVDEQILTDAGLLGSYARASAWARGRPQLDAREV